MTMHSNTKAHTAFLDALDLGGAVQRSTAGLAALRGTEALTLAIGLLLLDMPLIALAWHFDFAPTIAATSAFSARIIPSLPASALPYTALVSLLFTLLPMLGEFCLPRLATAGVKAATVAIYALSLFDVITDWPNVAATMETARASFDRFGILAWPAFQLAQLLLLVFATHGFEFLAVLIGICWIKLIVQWVQ